MAAILLACLAMMFVSATVILRGRAQKLAFAGNATAPGRVVPAGADPWSEADWVHSDAQTVAKALYAARSASAMPADTHRDLLLEQAIAAVEPLLDSKPYWGEASVVLAYAYGLRDPADPRFLTGLAESYRRSPYLRVSAYWRIRVGLDNWERLDPATQRHMVNEAVWFTRVNPGALATVLPLFRESPAYTDFQIVRLRTRVGDRGFSPIEALTQQQPGK